MRAVLNMLGFTSGGGLTVGRGILPHLEDVAPNDEFLVLVPDVAAYEKIDWPKNASKSVFSVSNAKHLRRLWIDHIGIPALCKRFGADVLFSMSNFGPYRAPCAHVLGVHLGYLAYPDWPIWERLTLRERLFIRAQARYFAIMTVHVDRICVLTQTSADRLATVLAIPPDRLVVVPNASIADAESECTDDPRVRDSILKARASLRLCYPALGYSNKNHEILPRVFERLQREPGLGDVVIFVTVEPGDSPNARRFVTDTAASSVGARIINLGHLDRRGVSTLYRYTDALLMPTLLESFSLTYVEAMRFELPILTSDYDFAHEVCGQAALYFDPLDPAAIAAAVARLARQHQLRTDLKDRGIERVRQFGHSWREITEQYVRLLREVCG